MSPRRNFARLCPWLSVLIVVVASLLMLRQERNYNQVFDEGAHIACGMEWLSLHTYTYETLHPPLARALTALPLFLTGIRSEGHNWLLTEGTALLNHGDYAHNLLLARLGVMPCFWLANLLIYLWMRRHFDNLHALAAVALFSFAPPVLAHSALATTDAPFMAMFLLGTLGIARMLEKPTAGRGALAGFCFGLALLSKFTALPFTIVTLIPLMLWYWRGRRTLRPLLLPVGTGVGVLCLLIWSTFYFSFDTFFTPANIYPKAQVKLATAQPLVQYVFLKMRIPAVEFFRGLYSAFLAGAKQKRNGYVLGQFYSGGRWYFFPVAVLSKTPIALLVLAALGLRRALGKTHRGSVETALLVGGLIGPMTIAILGDINLGLRHVLPIYPFLAMAGAVGAGSLLHQRWPAAVNEPVAQQVGAFGSTPGPILAGALVLWQVIACVIATPQFLPYFNEAAMPFFGYILVDSDLDWGQDLYHLEDRLKDVDPTTVSYRYFGDETIMHHRSALWKPLLPKTPVSGWVAVSESSLRREAPDFNWLNGQPFERIGRSIRLYHIADSNDEPLAARHMPGQLRRADGRPSN